MSFTELIQRPARTAARLAGTRASRLRRRGADDLMLMSAARVQQEGEVVDLTACLLAGVPSEHGGADLVRRVLPAVLAWVRFLPPAAVDQLCRLAPGNTRAAFEAIRANPCPVPSTKRHHQLNYELAWGSTRSPVVGASGI